MNKIFAIVLTALFAVSFLSVPKPASAGQVTLNPRVLADTYVNSGDVNRNRGSDTQFDYGYWNDLGTIHEAYLKFDVVGIPANATIDSAYLRLYKDACSGNPNPTTFNIKQVTGNWSENSITWQNRPTTDGGAMSGGNTSCITGYANYSITNIVNEWKNGDPNYGFVIYGPKNSIYFRMFWSREAGVAHEPLLTIRYTVPDSVPGGSGSGNPGVSNPDPTTGITTGSVTTSTTTAGFVSPPDANVAAPKLYKVYDGGKDRTITNGEAEINTQYATVVGSSTPGYKILCSINGTIYETTTNSLGYWGVNVDTKDWKEGVYKVEAQAVNGSGKGSPVVSLVNLNKVDLEALARRLSADSNTGLGWLDRFGIMMVFLGPIGSLLFWILLILLIIWLVHRHNKKKKEKAAAAAQPAPDAAKEPKKDTKSGNANK